MQFAGSQGANGSLEREARAISAPKSYCIYSHYMACVLLMAFLTSDCWCTVAGLMFYRQERVT